MRNLLLVGAALFATLPMSAAIRGRGGFFVGPGFGPFGWYDPFYGPYAYGPYVIAHPNAGQVKLDTNVKDAQVFINGSYAGTVGKLKTMWLQAGPYNVEVRAPGGAQFSERIYVVPGKTIKLHPDLHVETRS